jgi:hypoxanthine-guanine phosphoribosyltransferase
MDEKEVTTKVYLDEKNSSHTPKRVNLVQLLDVKEKKIATIQADIIELKLEKELVFGIIKEEAKNLEYTT